MNITDQLNKVQQAVTETDGDCILLYADNEKQEAHISAVIDDDGVTALVGFFLQQNPQLIPAVLNACSAALQYNAEHLLENIPAN